jgi:hypothetical protein
MFHPHAPQPGHTFGPSPAQLACERVTPRSIINASTSRELREKREYNQTL